MSDKEASLNIKMGGCFRTIQNPRTKRCSTEYVNGSVLLDLEYKKLTMAYLEDVLRNKLKYDETYSFWYKRKGMIMHAGREQICSEKDVEDLLRTKNECEIVQLYVVQAPNFFSAVSPMKAQAILKAREMGSIGTSLLRTKKLGFKSIAKKQLFHPEIDLDTLEPLERINPQESTSRPPENCPSPPLETHINPLTPPETHISPLTPTSPLITQNNLLFTPSTHNNQQNIPPLESQKPGCSGEPSGCKEGQTGGDGDPNDVIHGSEDDTYDSESDEDYVLSGDDELDGVSEDSDFDDLYAEYIDQDIEANLEADKEDGLGPDLEGFEEQNAEDLEETNDVILSDEDELNSEADSDDDGRIYPTFNPAVDFKRPINLTKGLKFPNYKVFKKALRFHCIEKGYDYYYLHNQVSRVDAYCKHRCDCAWNKKKARLVKCKCNCKDKCGFRVHGRLLESQTTFQIKSLTLTHEENCPLADYNTKLTSEYIAEKYLDEFRLDPDYKIRVLIAKIVKDCGVQVAYYKAYYAREKALKMIYGADAEQYKRVWDFAETVKKWNPGSSMYVTLDNIESPAPSFKRMYMCLNGCKVGFVRGCRPIIGLDGCHLKGLYTGILLTAVGKDGNCNLFPIAWAVVESETKETWTWFIELLIADIRSVANEDTFIKHVDDIALISDRQKGLLEAFNVVVPQAELRFCARHIWANFSKTYNGVDYKQMFWKAARAYNKPEFDQCLESIKGMSTGAFQYLAAIPPRHWSRHAFSDKTKSEILLNNCCESFNNVLRKCRDKPILSLMEWIRRYVMNRMFGKLQVLEKYNGDIMKNVKKSLGKIGVESRDCRIIQSGLNLFEVDLNEDRWVVNLDDRTCGCYKWNLTGIPCAHAYACIVKKRLDPQSFVHQAYSRELYALAYSSPLHPLPGPKQWERTIHLQPTPPLYKKMAGRPSKKKRKVAGNEGDNPNQRTAKKRAATCLRCGLTGHYAKACKQIGADRMPKKKISSQRSEPTSTQEVGTSSSALQPSQTTSQEAPHTAASNRNKAGTRGGKGSASKRGKKGGQGSAQ